MFAASCEKDDYIFTENETFRAMEFDAIDRSLSACRNAEEMLQYLTREIRGNREKLRFRILETKKAGNEAQPEEKNGVRKKVKRFFS